MRNRIVTSVLALIVSVVLGPVLAAHGGGLDHCGGHTNHKTGDYHVHNMASYCACHPTAAGCGGANATPKEPTKPLATPQSLAAPTQGTSPATETVYITTTGTKYHRAGCRYLANSAIATPLSDAARLHTPCSICKPPMVTGTGGPGSASTAIPPQSSSTSKQCAATTKKGTRCSRSAAPGSAYCWQHGGQ
jgi:hypothetical protein